MHKKPLELKILGTPKATWNGAPLALPRRQARALLYRLAAKQQPVSRDALLLLLQPDSAETTARRNLTRLLSYLRGALPDPNFLQTTRAGVLLAPDLTRSDAVDFARHIPLNDEPAWEAAVDLVRGPFLDGFALPSSTEFDSWQSLMQQQVERHTLAALSRLVTAKTAAAARATLDPKQQQLPDEVDEVLGTTVATWDTNDENSAQSYLETAVQLAQQYGYL